MSSNSVPKAGQKVGVAMAPLPKPEVHLPGAGCLLCIMAATAANSSLSKHTESLNADELRELQERVAAALRARGAEVLIVPEPLDVKRLADAPASSLPNAARKDHMPLKRKYGVDKLVVIAINQVGFERNYAAYIPQGDPKALVGGLAYMVNLETNAYEWYLPVSTRKSADSKWDEPPRFPGLTNAYFQALEVSKDTILRPLAR